MDELAIIAAAHLTSDPPLYHGHRFGDGHVEYVYGAPQDGHVLCFMLGLVPVYLN